MLPPDCEESSTAAEVWIKLKTGLLKRIEEVCGTTRPHRWRCETWWWSEDVAVAVKAKRRAFKAWKAGKGTKETYYVAKRIAKGAVHHSRKDADRAVFENMDPKSSESFGFANQMRRGTLTSWATSQCKMMQVRCL